MSWKRVAVWQIRLNGSLLRRWIQGGADPLYCGDLRYQKQCSRGLRCSSQALHQYDKISQSPAGPEIVLPCEDVGAGADDDQMVECEARGQKQQGALWIMLLLHATQNDLHTVLALLKKAEDEGLEPSVGVMMDVVMAFVKNGNVDAALQLHTKLRAQQASHVGGASTLLSLCTLLVESGRHPEALKNLKDFISSGCQKREELNMRADCRKLLDAAANTCDHYLTQEVFDQLLRAGWIQPESFTVVPLLQSKMNIGDLEGVVEEAEHVFWDYKLLPKRMEILIAILKDYADKYLGVSVPTCMKTAGESGDLLDRMLSLMASCYGEGQARHDFFFACLESGHSLAAEQVLQSLGKEVNSAQVVKMCGLYGRTGREDVLLHLLSVSGPGHTHTTRHKAYSALLDIYIDGGGEEEARKALGLFQAMLTEDLTPSPAFLASLAHLLTAVGVELPPAHTPY